MVRMCWSAMALLVLLTCLHAVTFGMAGDPVRALFGLRSPGPELIAELRDAYGLDDPYLQQLLHYLTGLFTGDLGPVYGLSPNGLSVTGQSVNGLIWAAMPSTLIIVGLAFVLQTIIGISLSVRLAEASPRAYSAWSAVASLLVAVPSFLIAGLFERYAPGLVDAAEALVAAACLAALPTGLIALVGNPLVRETRKAEFVRRARASGISRRRVRWLHALRPSLGHVMTLSTAETSALFAAAVLVEPVLGRSGIGSVLVSSIDLREGPITLAVVGVYMIAITVMTLLADVLLAVLDPRQTSL